MTLPIFQKTIVDDRGDILPGATIDVFFESSGARAQLYSDSEGLLPISNPTVTDAFGKIVFYIDPGLYRISATSGGFSDTYRNVRFFDESIAELDIGSVADFYQLTGSFDGHQIELISYHPDWKSWGEGIPRGGDPFVWDETGDKSEHDGAYVIDPDMQLASFSSADVETYRTALNSGQGVWRRNPSTCPTLSKFGAKFDFNTGTGVGFNCSGALQAAINHVQTGGAIGGGMIADEKGDKVFEARSQITQGGVYIVGPSRRACRWFSRVIGDHLLQLPLPDPDSFGSTYFGFGFKGIRIQGYGNDGLGGGCGRGLSIEDANGVTLQDMTCSNFPDSTACYMRSGAFNNVISHCEFVNSQNNLDINGGSGTPNKITMVMLDHVECSGSVGGNSMILNQCAVVILNSCTIQDATHLAGSLSTTGQNLRMTNCETVIINDPWVERSEGQGIYAENCQNITINYGHHTSAGYTGGAVGTEDPSYPSIEFVNVDNYFINRPFFYERTGNHIEIDVNSSMGEIALIPVRDGTMPAFNDLSTNGAAITRISASEDKLILSNRIYEAPEFRAASTNGVAVVGADGNDHQMRFDGSGKAYFRDNTTGVVIASGDMHYGGSTASRPASPKFYQSYFDTTITKPIWWTGSGWVDATGSVV